MRKHHPPHEPGSHLPDRLVKDGWWLAADPPGRSDAVVPFCKQTGKPGAAVEKRTDAPHSKVKAT
jgi:hypothetical protein